MLYGSETWAVTVEGQRRMERTEMQMVRSMCGCKKMKDTQRHGLKTEDVTDRCVWRRKLSGVR